jgi:drug/metabolite transporter (DMT)-like permease
VLAIALALGSSVCFGVSDFIAGLQARRVPLLGLLIVSQLVALLILVAIVAVGGTSPPPLVKLLPAAGAGLGGMIALAAFFRALAIGTMSIVAPISSTGAAVPVLVGIASGNRPTALQVGGIVAVVIGIVLAGREASDGPAAVDAVAHPPHPTHPATRTSVWLALFAAGGFGGYLVGVRTSAQTNVLWTLAAARVSAVAVLGLVLAFLLVAQGRSAHPVVPRTALPAIFVVGVLDLAGNVLYAVASRHGELAIIGVVASLYPIATVLLARAMLHERVRRMQEVGIVAAILGVLLVAAG